MRMEHIAIWADNLERMKLFYTEYFHMQCSDMYVNELKGFSSYFLSFEDGYYESVVLDPEGNLVEITE